MKKRVPPSAQEAPKKTAKCIHTLRRLGKTPVKIPLTKIGNPTIDGINEVNEFESDITDTAMPQTMSIAPYPIVRFAMVRPSGLYSSAIVGALTEYLKFL